MKGFIAGSLVLIVLETVLQPNTQKNITGLAGVLQSAMRRGLAPDVAGVPNRFTRTAHKIPRSKWQNNNGPSSGSVVAA